MDLRSGGAADARVALVAAGASNKNPQLPMLQENSDPVGCWPANKLHLSLISLAELQLNG